MSSDLIFENGAGLAGWTWILCLLWALQWVRSFFEVYLSNVRICWQPLRCIRCLDSLEDPNNTHKCCDGAFALCYPSMIESWNAGSQWEEADGFVLPNVLFGSSSWLFSHMDLPLCKVTVCAFPKYFFGHSFLLKSAVCGTHLISCSILIYRCMRILHAEFTTRDSIGVLRTYERLESICRKMWIVWMAFFRFPPPWSHQARHPTVLYGTIVLQYWNVDVQPILFLSVLETDGLSWCTYKMYNEITSARVILCGCICT